LRSANDIDKLYFALVDMSDKTQIQVPSIILNAMIDGTGKLNLLDRGFATLQEYEPVFKVTPDIESYNSLLHATAKSRSPKVTVLLSLLQQMEENNITPNNISYSILIECMIDNNDMNGISDIMNYMVEQNIVPTLRALRRLVIYYEKNEMNEKSIEIINLYKKTTNKILPKFFLDRIKNIQEEKTKEKQKDGDDVKEKSMLFNRISFGSKK
jgi:pentatricopeptide repeat protein